MSRGRGLSPRGLGPRRQELRASLQSSDSGGLRVVGCVVRSRRLTRIRLATFDRAAELDQSVPEPGADAAVTGVVSALCDRLVVMLEPGQSIFVRLVVKFGHAVGDDC